MLTTTDKNAERRKRDALKKFLESLKSTAIEIHEPIQPFKTWHYSQHTKLTLATDGNLYRLKGNRRFKLLMLEPEQDKGWTAEELTPLVEKNLTQIQSIQQQIQEQHKQYLEVFQTALPHERTDIRLKADFDKMVDEYWNSEECKRDFESIDAFQKQLDDEKIQREKQGLVELW